MDDETSGRSRRQFVKIAAALGATGAIAGCSDDSGSTGTPADDGGDTTATPTDTPTAESTATPTETPEQTTEAPTSTQSGVETPYSVSIEPMGSVEFESVPETWVANNGSWADMGIALGQEPPKGVWLTSRYHTQYYDEIPGVSVDKSDMVSLSDGGAVGKEQFFEFDADVHVIDPNFLMNRFKGWEQADIDEVREQVGPFFGNSIFSTGYPWHQDYRYYSMMEAFEKLSQVFQQQERYEAFEAVHEEFQTNLAPVVPGRSERPSVAVVWGSGDQPKQFYPYTIGSGTSFKHLRDLKVKDALADSDVKDFHSERAAIDFETLLEVDPPVILLRGQEAKSRSEFQNTTVSFLEDHQTASALTAVQNGDVYRAGSLYQGPITNLVLTERLAGELYGADTELFDRERVGQIVNGDL
ncbi:ABC transporter substrate-binding protein [Halosimplex aquaticum]|uniref:ABC transporter substrate-binding protein n=1 Tax=Halosimplex aquaticum TaxID=3026162 RepID=A0ABD5XWY8_9EURY|nr:ABC transporter substrate-binding protein [Halosimplex aquaticum]